MAPPDTFKDIIIVKDEVVLRPLGKGLKCEVNDCGRHAYKVCDDVIQEFGLFFWQGCGRKICYEHLGYDVDLVETDDFGLHKYTITRCHCKGGIYNECNQT